MEGISSIVQLIKRNARGYRNTQYFITMVIFTISFFKDYIPLIFNSIISAVFVPAKKL